MRLGLFATSGYTEVGGLQRFLARALPNVQISRLHPAAEKPPRSGLAGLKVGGDQRPGLTGASLVDDVVRRISLYGLSSSDAVLVVDDADCRFECDAQAGYDGFVEHTVARIRNAAGQADLAVFVLLASPEIEAWLLADFDSTFGDRLFLASMYASPTDAKRLRHALAATGFDTPSAGWEAYGCPPTPDRRACSRKLSEDLIGALARVAGARRSFSKRHDGAAMLVRADPDRVRAHCRRYAAPVLARLTDWGRG